MAEQDGDKSQEPTQHRRDEARGKGQVAQSQDLSSAVLLVVAISALLYLGSSIARFFGGFAYIQLGGKAWLTIDTPTLMDKWWSILTELSGVLLPFLGVMLLAAIIVNLAQVGFLFLPERLSFDLSRISLLKGMMRILSLQGLMRLLFGMIKILVVISVAGIALYLERETVLASVGFGVPQLALFVSQISLWTCLKIGVALLILALIDYAFQYWKNEQDMKMTTQEVREEMKNLQGDPQLIARRRVVQRQLALNRLPSNVMDADVVVTNPTELAIAIKYDIETMLAPTVVAKGAGVIAQRIRKLALEHGVPIVEKKPLAQMLYKEVEEGKPIPNKMFAAVAEVLAYVYQLKGKPLPELPKV